MVANRQSNNPDGRPLKWGEPTVVLAKRIPESISEEVSEKLDKLILEIWEKQLQNEKFLKSRN